MWILKQRERVILLTLILLSIQSTFAKRAEIKIGELLKISDLVFLGYVESIETSCAITQVLKSFKGEFENGQKACLLLQDLRTKPNENPDSKGIFLFFAMKADNHSTNLKIYRRLKVDDFIISKNELSEQKIITECQSMNVNCMLK